MKISQSAVQLGYEHKKSTSTATLAATQVEVFQGNVGDNGSTASSRAQIIQQQTQTLTDNISSSSQSLVTNTQTSEKQYFESADFLKSISSVFIEEDISVRSVQALDNNRINMGASQIKVTSVSQFESDTQIQASAVGSVITEDGSEIDFMLNLNYDRNIQTTQKSTFTGQRDLIDPLVLNLNGGAPSLSSGYFEFDLNSDGVSETLNQTAQGTGFLAFDKNQNGTIDNGQELFGPNAYSGFAELAQYDDDDNGWIDENDAIFSQLSYMDFDESGEQKVQSISDVGLGAIYLGSEKMDFDLFDSDGQFKANIARNGMALKENGQVISLQEIHYSDQAIGKPSMEKTNSIVINNQLIANGNLGFISEANADTSIVDMRMTASAIRVTSPLTQFQFDNDIINGRIAETSVKIETSERPNFITVDGIRNQFSSNITVTNMGTGETFNGSGGMIQAGTSSVNENRQHQSHASSIPFTQATENNTASTNNTTRSQRRSDMQAIFKARIEAGFTITNTKASSNPSTFDKFDVPTLSQSVFWQDERHQYQSKYDGKSKLDQLKQLVNDLKEIREQQVKSQEKLGLYSNISMHKS